MDSVAMIQLQRRLLASVLRQSQTMSFVAVRGRGHANFMPRVHSTHLMSPAMSNTTSSRHYASQSRTSPPPPSASSSQSSSRAPPAKHTSLEQPETFRPPSHGSRLKSRARSTTASYGSLGADGNYSYAGGYNQGSSGQEREDQKKRRYPNMFPNEGSFMYWFLTHRGVHLWISLGTLSLLATITLSQSFLKTSPFAHLLPPLSSLIFHPIDFTREFFSVVRLHIDYTTEQTAEKRRQNILDAQKRRLYRRAHGIEDIEGGTGDGVDVKGLVDWDDGLTGKEREKLRQKRMKEEGAVASLEGVSADAGSTSLLLRSGDGSSSGSPGDEQQPDRPQKKKVKRWLGIWE